MDDRQLPKAQHDRIFEARILPDSGLDHLQPAPEGMRPRAIVLAGQPGAGKGGLRETAKSDLNGNAIVADPDDLRARYPGIRATQNQHPISWANKTDTDASLWARELTQRAIEQRKNVIIDTTLGNADGGIALVKRLQQSGYDVEIRAMATHPLESRVGIDTRLTTGIDKAGYGRDVTASYHEQITKALPDALDRIHAETGVPVRVHDRQMRLLYDSTAGDSRTPGVALRDAWNERMTDPAVTKALRDNAQKQVDWHSDPDARLAANPKVSDAGHRNALADLQDQGKAELARQTHQAAVEIDHDIRIRPQRVFAGRALGAANVAMAAIDASVSGKRAHELHAQGNVTGMQSEIVRFGSRNLGMLGGTVAGASAGAAVTAETGPGLLVGGAIGGFFGTVAGDKVADWIDQHRINNQTDNAGNRWHFDPKQPAQGWTRQVPTNEVDTSTAALAAGGAIIYKTRIEAAAPEVADALTFKASSKAAEIALAYPPRNQNPHQLPAAPSDPRSLRDAPWIRNPDSDHWQRRVAEGLVDRSMEYRTDIADPQRSAQLDAQAQAVMRDNAARTPHAMAQRFQHAYAEHGWSRHGPMPQAVTDALQHPSRIVASDGERYHRDLHGRWSYNSWFKEHQAERTIARELEGTWQAQESRALPPLRQGREDIPTLPPVTATLQAAATTPNASAAQPPDMTRVPADAPRQKPSSSPLRGPAPAEPDKAGPPHATLMSQPGHPDHALFTQIRRHMHALDRERGRTPDHHSDQLAGALVPVAKVAGMHEVRHVVLDPSGSRAFAIDTENPRAEWRRRAHVDVAEAVNTPLESSQRHLDQVNQMLARQQAPQHEHTAPVHARQESGAGAHTMRTG